MATSGKKILGIGWIKRLARSFTPEQFRQQYLAKPLAQQRMEEQTKRRTDEELMAAFPEYDELNRECGDGVRDVKMDHLIEVNSANEEN